MSKSTSFGDFNLPFSRRLAGPLLFVLALFYLGFHAVSGERGLFALFTENRRLEALKSELAEVKADRMKLENKVHRLSNNSLDLDLLDEQVKRVLGMAGKNEVVYFIDNQAQPQK